MATTADTLVKRVRRFVRDYPDLDVTTGSLTNVATAVSVADTTLGYHANRQALEIDQELLYVTGLASSVSLTVRRGVRGTTAATHASAAPILINPRWFYQDYLDALNSALDACYPYVYTDVIDTSLVSLTNTYEYTIPNLNGLPIPYIEWVRVKEQGDVMYRPVRQWRIQRGTTPKLIFKYELPATASIEIKGIGPLTHLAASTDTLPAFFPFNAEDALVYYAGSCLLLGAEAWRDRVDTGVVDKREQANRPGVSLQTSNAMLGRFQARLSAAAMPPPSKHLVPTI